MKNILSYENRPEKVSLWKLIWPTQDLNLSVEDLKSTIGYHNRMHRNDSNEEVESEVISNPKRLKFHATTGRFISDGIRIYRRND